MQEESRLSQVSWGRIGKEEIKGEGKETEVHDVNLKEDKRERGRRVFG